MARSSNYLQGREIQSSDEERRSQRKHGDCDCEDDAFYAEIRRQILILTAEQGDNDEIDGNRKRRERKGPPTRGGRVLLQVAPAGRYFSWCDETDRISGDSSSSPSTSSSSSVSTPDWLVNLWRNNRASGSVVGTGVFIPQIVRSGGRNRPRRRRSEGNGTKNKHLVQSVSD
ncbi:unnamed protein product [Linum trigynum]|uniref:Uncharacterized protein n=1 Tax=Linum trigynum TaxID=586398 RepID=A0AAV2F3G8_9ROSI